MSLDINTQIENNFIDNIQYFQKNQTAIFNKISEFEMAVENGFYQLRYELIYENDTFNAIELETQKLFYKQGANSVTNKALQSINPFYAVDTTHALTPSMNYTKAHLPKEMQLCNIYKFIFFGTGLGLHVQALHAKIQAKAYLFVEDDLELFRLSMFCINYKKLAEEATLFFSVFEEKNSFLQKNQDFLNYKEYLNHALKFFKMDTQSTTKLEEFQKSISLQTSQIPLYSTLLQEYLKPLKNIFKGYKFLTTTTTLSNELLDTTPFLLVTNNDSLNRSRKWLQENHHRFVTVAALETIKLLQEIDVHVDIITYLNTPNTESIDLEDIKESSSFTKTICLFSANTPSHIMKCFTQENIFLFEEETNYKKYALRPDASEKDSLTYQLMLLLHVKSIYLLGFDFSLDAHTDIVSKENSFDIEGNFHAHVATTPSLFAALQSINNSSRFYKKTTQNVYNLSNGAKLQGTFSLHPEDIHLKTLSLSPNTLYEQINRNIDQGLSAQELENLHIKLKSAQELQAYFRALQNEHFTSKESYLESLESLYDFIVKVHNEELSQIFYSYLQTTLGAIFTFFNTKNIQNTLVHVQAFNTLLSQELLALCENYISKITEEL